MLGAPPRNGPLLAQCHWYSEHISCRPIVSCALAWIALLAPTLCLCLPAVLSPQVSLRDGSRKAQTHLNALHDLLKNTADHIQHSDELKSRMSPEEWGEWRVAER